MSSRVTDHRAFADRVARAVGDREALARAGAEARRTLEVLLLPGLRYEGQEPAFLVFGIRAGTRLTRHISLSAAVENILDEDYRYHGSGSNEAGTNFVLMLRADF